MENKSNLTDDLAKEMMEKIFSDPEVRAQITGRMISTFSGWAVDNHKQEDILKLLTEFKTIIAACLNAKPEVDGRIALLAIAIMTEDFAVAQAQSKAKIVLEDAPKVVTEQPTEAKEWKQ
jgi:hypothetical protein